MSKDQKPKLLKTAPELVSSEHLVAAFSEIEPSLTKLQRDTLSAMYRAPEHSIPIDVAGQYSNIVNAFGKVGGKISRQLGLQPDKGYHLLWIAYQSPDKASGTMVWRMRDNFARALEMLGW